MSEIARHTAVRIPGELLAAVGRRYPSVPVSDLIRLGLARLAGVDPADFPVQRGRRPARQGVRS